jgi:PAS domain S-box-containing protein
MLKKNVDENSCNDASAVPNSSILEIAKFISTHRGSEALNEIAAFAALHFDVQYVHIALLQSDRHSVEVVAGYLEGKAVEPGYTYDLFGTPCQNVIEHDHRCYAQHVQQLFPEDEDLMQLHAEGYIGEPINAGDGSVIGLIVLVSQKPLQSSSLIAASMRILASYVSNIMIANEVRRERERYKHLMRYAFDGIILHDMNHNIIDYNYKAKVMLGYSDDEMLRLNVVDFDVNYSEQKIASLVEAVKQEAITFQTRHRRKDGTLYDAAVTAVLTALDGDDYFYTTIRDVSEQNHMQQRLQESQLLLKTVINEMPDVLAVKDENANFVLVNETLANLYETTPEMMPGKDDGYFGVPDEMNNFFRQNVLGIMDKGEPEIVFEDSRDAKTGEIRHFRSIKKPFKTTEGKQRILILAQDITELIETQNSLEKSLEQLQSMLQTTRDAYWLLDATGKILDVNEAMCDMMGYSHQELLQMSVTQIEANENSSQAQRHMEKIIQDGSDRFESIHRRKDSTLIDVDASVTYISSQRLFIAFIRDISEQKQFERDLSQQRGFLKTLVQTIPDLVWLKDPDGLYLACNPRFESFFGAKEEEIIGKSDYDFVDKELADFFRMHDKNVMTNKMPSVNEETISFASDGHKELLQTSKTPMYDGNGNLIGVLGVGHDISALRAYEETIRQSEESFRSLFDSLQEAVYVQDEQGVFLAVNKGAQRMYGYPVEWFVGKTPLDISAPGMNDLEALMPAHQSAMAGEPQSFEFWALRSD